MNNRGIYALMALFFAGLVGLWAADYARIPTRAERDRHKGRILVGLIEAKPDDLRGIEIAGGPEPIAFERREGNRWQMTSPRDVAADPSLVEGLAFRLKELIRRPEADTLDGDAASYGLAPPSRTVRLWGAATDAPLATLELGKTSLNRRYVRAGGSEGVEVVTAEGLELVDLPPAKWRDRELFRVPSFDVDAVTLTGPGRDLELRRGADAWRITAPIRALAIETRVDGLVADLGSLRVTDDSRFVADDVRGDDLDRFGLKAPTLTIRIEAGRGGRPRPAQVLQVGKAVEGKGGLVYVKRGDQDDVVAVEGRVLAGLGSDPNPFRSPKVADIDPARVVHFQVKTEGKAFDVMRTGNDWVIVRPTAARADRQAVQDFLKALVGLETSIYLKPEAEATAGLANPALVLKVWEVADPRPGAAAVSPDAPALVLQVGRRDAATRSLYGRVEGDKTILALPETAGNFLPRTSLALRERLVLAVATERVERLVFEGQGRRVALNAPVLKVEAFQNAPIGWWMIEPVAGPADADSVGRLLKVLASLRVDGYAVESADDLAPYGLKNPLLTLTWSLPADLSAGPTPPKPGPPAHRLEDHSLLVGGQVPGRLGSRYAKLDDRPLVFTIGGETVATIDAEYRDHHVLTFDPDRIRRVHVTWPDREFDLVADARAGGPGWSIDGAIDAPAFNPASVPKLLKSAAALTTSRFAQHDGPFLAEAGLTSPRVAFRLDSDGSTPPRLLRIGKATGNGLVFATVAPGDEGPVFTLPQNLFADWIKAPHRPGDLPDNVFAPD